MFRDFTYDLENKLVSALPINAKVRTLSYDPLNRLDLYNPGTARRFIYDGDEVAAELDSSGNVVARYVRGDAPDELLVGYTSADPTARGWYHLDQRNSVVAITDPNGVATVVNRYDEYGQPQGGNYGTFQYTGQMWLGEIGIYNYKNRMYWPNERPGGRFLQIDPVGPIDSANLYQYALNDPVNLSDPLGLCSSDTWVCGLPPAAFFFGGASTITAGGNAYGLLHGNDCDVAVASPQCRPIEVVGRRRKEIIASLLPVLPSISVCPVIRLLGSHGRLRLGADFAVGYVGFLRGGLGLSLRGDGSLEADAYLGGGVGIGGVIGGGIGLDNAGGGARGGQAYVSREVCATGGFIITAGACSPSSSVSNPNVDWGGTAGGFSGGIGPKAGLAVSSTKTGNASYRTSGIC